MFWKRYFWGYGLKMFVEYRRDIFRLENLNVCQLPVFRYGLLMRNRGYIEFETLEKQCWSYIRNIKTAVNYFYTYFTDNLPIFLIGKIWQNIGICQTLGWCRLSIFITMWKMKKNFCRLWTTLHSAPYINIQV
jgi:hypothetical protein